MALAFLEYTFIFDPVNTWQQGTQFEADVADFFEAKGIEARIETTIGGTGRRVILLTRKKAIAPPPPPEGKKVGTQFLKKGKQEAKKSIAKSGFKVVRDRHKERKPSSLKMTLGRRLSTKVPTAKLGGQNG